ncbi:MAG: NUDIX domain-containing protein [Candidatus Izemoplasmatales bacterium]|jgi:8-oxo-dGTP pyrophosphatase MutT (NUDIX family)
MSHLFTLYREPDFEMHGSILTRHAVRAIIHQDDAFLFIQSQKYGEVKFPGGGRNRREHIADALAREVLEETGYRIHRRMRFLGSTIEYARDFLKEYDIFCQKSRYYFCQVHPDQYPRKLDPYEIEYGYEAVHLTLDDAIRINESVAKNDMIPWLERDTLVMKMLKRSTYAD